MKDSVLMQHLMVSNKRINLSLATIIISSFSTFPMVLFAAEFNAPKGPQQNYQQEQLLYDSKISNSIDSSDEIIINNIHSNNKVITKNSLLANPQLLQTTMENALMRKNIHQIKAILPIYQKSHYADPILINYARALIYHSERNYNKAITYYRNILAKAPELESIRYSLAVAFYQNEQYDSALQQFKRLQSVDLPSQMNTSVNQAVDAIKKQEEWKLYANFYFKKENNINNAPSQSTLSYGSNQFIFSKPEKATGFHLDVSASKRFNITNNWYSNLNLSLSNDYFWDNKEYNNLNIRAGVALGYHKSAFSIELEPFITKQLFGNKSYSATGGIKSHINYRVNKKLSISNTFSFSYEKFNTRSHLDGNRKMATIAAVYRLDTHQYWFAGMNIYNNETQYDDDSFTRKSAYIGWEKAWKKGLSTKIVLATNNKTYKGVDLFSIKRKDKNYSAHISLWHRSVYFYGITPKLVLSWDKTNSNHFYYDNREELKANIQFSTSF